MGVNLVSHSMAEHRSRVYDSVSIIIVL